MIESYSIIDLLDHLDEGFDPEDYLIVFDIDNTVAESIDQLASTQWFEAMIAFKMEQEELTRLEALEKTLPLNFLLVEHSVIQPVESSTVALIKKLQEAQHKVIALTARSPEPLKACTIEHLYQIDIDFTRTTIYDNDIVFSESVHYSQGVIFTGGDHKGTVLFNMLEVAKYTPKKIIFIDDKEHNHHAIKEVFTKTSIEHTCIWYRYCEQKEQQFELTFTEHRLFALCDQHPDIHTAYQDWLKPIKKEKKDPFDI